MSFTIISNNCWGAEIYKELKVAYNTPFVGLFVPPKCYITLLENFEQHIYGSLNFVECSKYEYYNQFRKANNHNYPIGILNSCIEIHFLHYDSVNEAKSKWFRRTERLKSASRIFLKFCDREVFDERLIERFDQLKFKNKVCFTTKKYHFDSVVQISELKNQKEVIDGKSLYHVSKFYFDVLEWINNENGKLNSFQKVKLNLRITKEQLKYLFAKFKRRRVS